MGTDIHLWAQHKTRDGKWRFVEHAHISPDPTARDYRVFSWLANVRGNLYDDSSPLANRGLPDGVADLIDTSGMHDISYATAKEIFDLESFVGDFDVMESNFYKWVEALCLYYGLSEDKKGSIRIIWGFDL